MTICLFTMEESLPKATWEVNNRNGNQSASWSFASTPPTTFTSKDRLLTALRNV